MYSSRKLYKLPSAHHFLGIEGEEEFLLIGRGRRGEHFGPDDRVDRRGVDFGPAGAAGHRAAEDLAVRIKLYVDLHGKVRAGVGRHTPVRPHGKDDLPHIFEPFYRVDRSRSRTAGGAGLGLALVRDIVEKHGGIIEILSEPGAGTKVVVKFVRSYEALQDGTMDRKDE